MLTQLSRYGTIAKLKIKSMSLTQTTRFFMKGSALAGTLQGGGLGVETQIAIESEEPPEQIRELIRVGEQSCFTLQSLVHPVPVRTQVTLNGQPLATADAAPGGA
jgi:hypothetical protein